MANPVTTLPYVWGIVSGWDGHRQTHLRLSEKHAEKIIEKIKREFEDFGTPPGAYIIKIKYTHFDEEEIQI